MSKYNKYAKALDEAFKTARAEFTEIYARYSEVEQKRENAPKGTSPAETVKKLEAERNYIAIKQEFEDANKRIWTQFNERRSDLRRELEKEIEANNLTTPEALDLSAVELLKSGVLSVDDFENLAAKYDENPTMLKYIAKYAKETAKAANIDRTEQGRLLVLNNVLKNGTPKVLRAWDELDKAAEYCSNQVHSSTRSNPRYTVTIGNQWENITEKAINDF